ncbi:MAG: DUF5320 domain-containing protein [Patescibacteria group bacterium]|nr:DUF5320 domain-containing protein [Patescibacteria group bacterium]
MPGFDGTGPRGEGPLTGRGLGPCGGGLGFRRGFGFRRFGLRRGLGYGMGRLGGFFGRGRAYSKKESLEDLREYRRFLEEELKALKEYESELQDKE